MADKLIYILVAILLSIGLVFSYSLPTYLELYKGWGEFHFFYRFLFFSILGLTIMYILSQCNPDKCIHKIGLFLLGFGFITIILMPTPILAPFCPIIKGARRWIKIFGFSIAPVEFFKIGIIYFFAWSFSRKLISNPFPSIKDEFNVLIPYFVILGIMSIYILIYQSDLGETLLILSIFYIMLIFTKLSPKIFLFLFIGAIIIFFIGISQKQYRLERLKTSLFNIYLSLPKSIQDMFDIQISSNDISYQIRQSINAIHNGGLTGVGIGNGELKMGFLSDVHTDFVLSGIAEELGIIGVLSVLILIIILIWRILKIANRLKIETNQDYVFKLFTVGIAILMFLETIFNIMGIIGFFPLKGLPIPFVSYGGSSIIAFSIAIGMILMISKKSDI